jgi:myo-inositol-1(or 4)-monophosphatase
MACIDPAFLRTAEKAARAGANAALTHYPGRIAYQTKPDTSLVCEADYHSEKAIIETIRTRYPSHRIISEEGGGAGKESEFAWIIDPIDGTANFIHRVPFFCVSVALYRGKSPLAAAVYAPMQDEMFATARETPSTLNGEPIHASSTQTLEGAYIDLYWERTKRSILIGSRLSKAITQAGGRVRNFGSSALSVCSVACGRSDAHIHTHILLHDVAAAAQILRNAGGRITDFSGRPSGDRDGPLIASNTRIHRRLLELDLT